ESESSRRGSISTARSHLINQSLVTSAPTISRREGSEQEATEKTEAKTRTPSDPLGSARRAGYIEACRRSGAFQSGRRLPHSKTLRAVPEFEKNHECCISR